MRIAKRLYMLYYGLYRRSIVPLWAHMPGQCLDYPIHKTTNIWHSIDAHFHDGVTYMSCTVSVEKAAIPSYMNHRNKAIVSSAKMQHHQSLMFDWCSLSGWSGSVLLLFLPLKAGNTSLMMFALNRQLDYPRSKTKNRWLCIDAHIQDGVWSVSLIFFPLRAAITSFMDLCNQSPVILPKCNTENWWHSVDTHLEDAVESESPLFLPERAANTSFMDVCNQSTHRVPKIDSHKLLMLGWRSFPEWGSDNVTVAFDYNGCQYVSYT